MICAYYANNMSIQELYKKFYLLRMVDKFEVLLLSYQSRPLSTLLSRLVHGYNTSFFSSYLCLYSYFAPLFLIFSPCCINVSVFRRNDANLGNKILIFGDYIGQSISSQGKKQFIASPHGPCSLASKNFN